MKDFDSQYWQEINKLKERVSVLEHEALQRKPLRKLDSPSPYDLNAGLKLRKR